MNVLLVIAVTLVIFCLVLICLVTGLPFWISTSSSVFYGLWDVCIALGNHEAVCRSFNAVGATVYDYIDATRAMVCICLILVFVASVLGCVVCCCKPHSTVCRLLAAICCLAGAIFIFLALVIFGIMFDDNNTLEVGDLSGAYWLTVPLCLILILTFVLFLLAKPKPKQVEF